MIAQQLGDELARIGAGAKAFARFVEHPSEAVALVVGAAGQQAEVDGYGLGRREQPRQRVAAEGGVGGPVLGRVLEVGDEPFGGANRGVADVGLQVVGQPGS